MKTIRIVLSCIALGLLIGACQNPDSRSGTNTEDTSANEHMSSMGSDTSMMGQDSSMMAGMNAMMKEMHRMKMTGNADYDLAMMLKHHHQGAIDMSEAELRSGTDEQLKDMAQKTIDIQKKEIRDLEAIADKYKSGPKNYDPANKNEGLGQDMDKSMRSMMEMGHDMSKSTDHQFASMMKKHHKDGVEMGEMIVKHAKDANFKSMTQKTMKEQKKDIEKLDEWLDKHKK
ncbi:hypothetical protein BCY91_06510 [Pelobium manganitolerans]|uniref:Zn-dependent PLC domain-containing protein n=1 Tax=Pelobium manganitolerans TaxID=1842495 RepID=A0A419S4Y8_9SPHI|nr:DUF305 domain-containing protein [Pelobium manganitolerans]RKD15168.1 hypothetical protein BCY91_06510 [Pelobium manganitolerans]